MNEDRNETWTVVVEEEGGPHLLTRVATNHDVSIIGISGFRLRAPERELRHQLELDQRHDSGSPSPHPHSKYRSASTSLQT